MLKVWIVLLVILAFILRIIFVFQGGVSFHYDMSRDAFEAMQIWKYHQLKILGPPTSTPGLYHGVFYYYLIALFYAIGNGDPRVAAVFLSLLSSLTVIPIILLTKDIFKSIKWVILSGILFVFSFEAIQYGPWLSDPGPALLTIALFFYFLRLWQNGQKWGLYLAVLSAALSAQFELFFLYLFVLIPIFKYVYKIKIPFKDIFISVLIAVAGLSSFIIATVKFNSFKLVINGFFNIISSGQINFRPSFIEQFSKYINALCDVFINNFFPSNVLLGGILALLVIYYSRKEKFILFCLFSNLPIFIFGGHSNAYINAGLVEPAILGLIIFLRRQNKYFSYLLISLIIISNLYAIFKYSPKGQIILVIPADMNLKNELALIDQTYKLSEGQPFSINSLTLPLWTNTTWAYLYSWYGKNKYGYVPSFTGHDQVGLLGNDVLPKADKPLEKTFFIIEPHIGIPENYFSLEIGAEDSRTELIKQFDYGELKLQLRKPRANE